MFFLILMIGGWAATAILIAIYTLNESGKASQDSQIYRAVVERNIDCSDCLVENEA
jgi:hypothetical protein